MDTDELVGAACREIVEMAKDRRAVLIFAASVAHAEHVKTTLERTTNAECGLVPGEQFDRVIGYELGEKPEPVPLDVAMGYDPDSIPF